MNKAFCRVFQFGMKVGMYFLPWRVPEVLEGPGAIKELPALVKKQGCHKVLVCTGSYLLSHGVLDPMFAALDAEGVGYVLCSGIPANPSDEDVERGVKLYLENGCDSLIAFGGGSPMDACKAVAARIVQPRKTAIQLQGLLKVMRKTPPVFAVPTTSGTGSETTIAAVITEAKTHHKASINDPRLIPAFAVLDPELTASLPPQTTAETGLDALCHAVECYTNNTYNTKLEKEMAEKSVRLIYDNLYEAYLHGDNIEARQNMQLAAFYAGRAFTRGCVGYVHAIGHTLGGLYGLPHGRAMGVLLPHIMRLYGSAAQERLARLAEVCGLASAAGSPDSFAPASGGAAPAACCSAAASDAEKAEAFIAWIEKLKADMQIPEFVDPIRPDDEPQIIAWATKEANPLYPTPVTWNEAEFKRALRVIQGLEEI